MMTMLECMYFSGVESARKRKKKCVPISNVYRSVEKAIMSICDFILHSVYKSEADLHTRLLRNSTGKVASDNTVLVDSVVSRILLLCVRNIK